MDGIKIWREEGVYIAHIPALGIVEQAKSTKELKKELKEAIELSIDSIIIDEVKASGNKANSLRKLLNSAVLDKIEIMISKSDKILLAKS